MNELAVRTEGRSPTAPQAFHSSQVNLSLAEVWQLAEAAAASKLFRGITSPQAAFTLMMLCQADGMHPMQALRRYHIIDDPSQGPCATMRADAIQAEFHSRGGRIKILRLDDQEARAVFSHPTLQPEGFEYSVTFKQFENTGLTQGKYGPKANWKHHPADMLWARLITKVIRKIDPGIVVGVPSTDEAQDLIMLNSTGNTTSNTGELVPTQQSMRAEVQILGQGPSPFDDRPYHVAVVQAVDEARRLIAENVAQRLGPERKIDEKLTLAPADVHRHLHNAAVQAGHLEGPPPKRMQDAIRDLAGIYKSHRDWVRLELMRVLEQQLHRVEAAIQAIEEEVACRNSDTDPPNDEDPGSSEAADEQFALAREPGSDG